MRIHHEELSDVSRYIRNSQHLSLEDKEGHFRSYMRDLRGYKEIDASTRILESDLVPGEFELSRLARPQGSVYQARQNTEHSYRPASSRPEKGHDRPGQFVLLHRFVESVMAVFHKVLDKHP